MKQQRALTGFMIFAAFVCLATLALNLINGRFHPGDFRVYYTAAERLISGEQVYLVSYYEGSGFYKYSPVTLLLFAPFTLLPLPMASWLHVLILSASYLLFFQLLWEITEKFLIPGPFRRPGLLLTLAFGSVIIHLTRELYLGNINILLLTLIFLSIREFLSGRSLRGSAILGLVILTKPYLAVLLLPSLMRGKWKEIAPGMIVILAGGLIPFLYPGPVAGFALYRDWFATLTAHSGGFPGMTSLGYLAGRLFPDLPVWAEPFPAVLLLLGLGLFITGNLRGERRGSIGGQEHANRAFEWYLALGLLPSMIRADWVLMQFTVPLVLYIILRITRDQLWRWLPLLFLLLFFFSLNSDDLLGRSLSRQILHVGLMGAANFFLAVFALVLYRSDRPLRAPADPPPPPPPAGSPSGRISS